MVDSNREQHNQQVLHASRRISHACQGISVVEAMYEQWKLTCKNQGQSKQYTSVNCVS